MKKVKNVPEWAMAKRFIVTRRAGDEWVFFDAGDSYHDAMAQSWEINGEVIDRDEG